MPLAILKSRTLRRSGRGRFKAAKNPRGARNIPGYKDSEGKFHPIRAGAGYDPSLAGDRPGTGRKRKAKGGGKKKAKKAKKAKSVKKAAPKKTKKKAAKKAKGKGKKGKR